MSLLGSLAAALTSGSLHFSMLMILLVPVLIHSIVPMMRTAASCVFESACFVCLPHNQARSNVSLAHRRLVIALGQLGLVLLGLPVAIVLDAMSFLLRSKVHACACART